MDKRSTCYEGRGLRWSLLRDSPQGRHRLQGLSVDRHKPLQWKSQSQDDLFRHLAIAESN